MPEQPMLVTVVLPAVDGLTRDEVQNTFGILCGDTPTTGDLDNIRDEFIALYTSANVHNSLDTYLQASRSRVAGACQVRIYDLTDHLDGSPHGSPVYTAGFGLGAPAGDAPLPAQVAAVVTLYAADRLSVPEEGPIVLDIPTPESAQDMGAPATHAGRERLRGRHRGRVYIGPLIAGALQADGTNSNVLLHPNFMVDLAFAFGRLIDNLAEYPVSTALSVWSRRDAAMHPVDATTAASGGRIDNSPDVIRKRKVLSTATQNILIPA